MDYYNVKELAKGQVYVGNIDPHRAIDYAADVTAALAANGHEDPANARFSEQMWLDMENQDRIPRASAYSE